MDEKQNQAEAIKLAEQAKADEIMQKDRMSRTVQAAVEGKYSTLCQELGHLMNNKKVIEDKISLIEQEVRAINDLLPEIIKYVKASK